MQNKIQKLFPVLILVLFFLLSANQALAAFSCQAPLVPCGNDAAHPCQFCDLFTLFNNLLQFVFFCLAPPFAIIGVVIGGVYFLVSQGNPSAISRGKDIMKAVAIGLFIIFAAWLLIDVFFALMGVAQWTGLEGGWNTICD